MSISGKTPHQVFVRTKSYRKITLIEVLIAMALIAMIGGVIAINVQGLLREQRFNSSVELVSNQLQTAQNLMVILNSDVKVVIDKNDQQTYSISLQPEKSVSKQFYQTLNQNKSLPGVSSMKFDDEEKNQMTLLFSALSQKTPEGVLELVSDDDESQYFSFPGYPKFIEAQARPAIREEKLNESSILYPAEVRESWQKKLNQKVGKK